MSSISANGIKAISSLASSSSVDGTETLIIDTTNGVKKISMATLTDYIIEGVLDELPVAEEESF